MAAAVLPARIKTSVRNSARALKTMARNCGHRVRYNGIFSEADKAAFGGVLEAWRPQDGPQTDILRWIMTEWCNFNCVYCDQTHERRAPKAGGFTAHCFDNFPVEKWMAAFQRHFGQRRLSCIITGGEPMLDAANMNQFLGFLTAAEWCTSIRIDTNASWIPRKYERLDKHKIALNCSYHPSQIREEIYFKNLAAIKNAGFRIGMVNYVLNREQREEFKRFQARVEALDLVMNVSPEFKERVTFTVEEVAGLSIDILEQDLPYRTEQVSPKGKPCLYPAISFEMDATGYVRPGCMPAMSGSFFDPQLPFYGNRIATCPYQVCSCLDKYSFLAEFGRNVATDPFGIYTGKLRELAARRSAGAKAAS